MKHYHSASMTFQAVSTALWTLMYLGHCVLQSAADRACCPTYTQHLSDRSFAAVSPQVWNNLLSQLRQDISYRQFRWQLKTFLFGTDHGTSWLFAYLGLRNILTYLLTHVVPLLRVTLKLFSCELCLTSNIVGLLVFLCTYAIKYGASSLIEVVDRVQAKSVFWRFFFCHF